MEKISNWFWSDYFWFPEGISFEDFKDEPGLRFPRLKDLIYFPISGIIFCIIRLLWKKHALVPIARFLGLADSKHQKPVVKHDKLETFYNKVSQKPSIKEIDGLSKQLDWTTQEIEKWFTRKRNARRSSLQAKFCEANWKCTIHLVLFLCGISSLWETTWLWDTKQCWIDYPRQNFRESTRLFYMVQGGYYVSQFVNMKLDMQRKDYLEMSIHHFATLCLLSFSYATNLVRMGSLIFVLHDASDIFLEAGKCFVYLKWRSLADVVFVIFAVSFFVTRLVVYPYFLLYSTFVESKWFHKPCPAYYFYTGLLISLQILHIMWFLSITRIAANKFIKGKDLKDDRSDVDEPSSDDVDPNMSSHD